MEPMKVAIVGSGLIGRSWAMLFASGGYRVQLYDIEQQFVDKALEDIEKQLKSLEELGMLRGTLSAEEQFKLIISSTGLEDCLKNAGYVQECVPENLDLKKQVWSKIDSFINDTDVILASSTSCILPSAFSEHLAHREQVLVAHPVNPPFYVPLVELVPAPWTRPEIVTRTREIMEKIGQSPVTLKKEIPGFALNRIQYAILNECWRLASEGILSVADIDTVMTDGLGPRYAFMGALETAHLNAEGMLDYCNRYGQTIHNVSNTFGPVPKMEGKEAENVHEQLCEKVPLSAIPECRAWRNERLAALAMLKKQLNEKK